MITSKIAEYYDGTDVITKHNNSSTFTRISPSSIANFFSHPRSWWGENFLNEEGFTGSTASILGTIVHHFAELAGQGQPIPNDADTQVEQYLLTITVEFDYDLVVSLWRDMVTTLVDGCITRTKLHSVEQFIFHQLLPGIYVGGTYDAIRPTGNGNFTLRDYKTSSSKPSGISYAYRMQLHTYAYILKQQGINIDTIELEFVTRPTKTLPCRHFHFSEPIEQEDYDKIESQLKTIAYSIELWNTNPDLRWALAQDQRLKVKPKPQLFKD